MTTGLLTEFERRKGGERRDEEACVAAVGAEWNTVTPARTGEADGADGDLTLKESCRVAAAALRCG